MTVKQLAAHYLRYWDKVDSGLWEVASNAPENIAKFARKYQPGLNRAMVGAALESISNSDVVQLPSRDTLLGWLMHYPTLDKRADALLKQKSAPQSVMELLHRTYRAEFIAVREDVRALLQAELAEYE